MRHSTTSSTGIRVGVIGTGVMGADHARTISSFGIGASVNAVNDIDEDRSRKLASELGARHYASAEELVGSPDVDAVIIASHDSAHLEQVLTCLEHRKPVLCEKPLAPTVAECARIVEAQRELGLANDLVSVGFMRRFHPAYVALKEKVHSGDLGSPLMILSSHRNVTTYPFGGSEGTITNAAVHEIDITAWLLESQIVEVSWHAPKPTTVDTTRHDPQLLHLRTADGVLTSVDVFVNARYGYDIRAEVVCEHGAVRLAPTALLSIDQHLLSAHTHPADWRPFFAEAYRLELQGWITSLLDRTPSPLARAVDGLRASAVANALITSMKNGGGTVAVEDVSPTVDVLDAGAGKRPL